LRRYPDALRQAEQALAKFQAIGDCQGEAIAFSNIADIRWRLALRGYESLGCPEATTVRARLHPQPAT